MKQKILIFNSERTVFKGKALNLPIKESFLVEKSIELFDDDDPCIIHQSYVVKEYVNFFLGLFKTNKEIKGENFVNELSFLEIDNIDQLTFKIMG